MPDLGFLDWPFFEPRHRDWRHRIAEFAATVAPGLVDHDDADGSCRRLVVALGKAGLLAPTVVTDPRARFDVRALCLARETLAYHDGLADFAFAMQGLGSGPVSLFGTPEQRQRWLPPVAAGQAIAAFALTEPEAGSDVASITTTATADGPDHVRLNGEKTFVSNGGIADHYIVFARTGEAPGARGLSAFMVEAGTPGFVIAERIETTAPHPLARVVFTDCRVPIGNRIGNPGEGFKVAMATLDVFRSTVGAAALGFARRALHETVAHAAGRRLFGAPLGDLQMTQAAIADSASEVDASALLVYRAAWTKDQGAPRVTREAAMAKMVATEAAQRVIDRAVQLHGGLGIKKGVKVEELYREIRALRIYEGATEVQKIVIARELLKNHPRRPAVAAE
jgi:acyl-CoA dehydrogenase